MSEVNRLGPPYGSLIDRGRSLTFTFEGETWTGLQGDTIASALAANGRWLISRSFKYHRPRAVLTMAGQDANALVQCPGAPNTAADVEPLRDGLEVRGQHYRGSLDRDRWAIVDRFARFLPVGFYYKAFYRPHGAWERWAPRIRRMAGLGVIDPAVRDDDFDKQYQFCDVAVIGGGPAGLEAALAAAGDGAEVVLVDEWPVLGGSLNYARFDAAGAIAAAVRAELLAALQSQPGIRVMSGTLCNGWFADHWLPLIGGRRMIKLRAGRVVMCSGSLEQQALFHNNDLPGVMMGSAAQRLIRLYAVRPGRRAVILAGNDDAYGVALDLLEAGVEVAAVVDMRDDTGADDRVSAVRGRGVRCLTGHAVYSAEGGNGHLAVVDVRALTGRGRCAGRGERIACDLLCMSVGFAPAWQLPAQAGATLGYDDGAARFSIADPAAGVTLAGSVAGLWALDAVRADGRRAGGGKASPAVDGTSPNCSWPLFPHPSGKEFVDYDEDLQIADIVNAVREGYEDVQLVKRYSTVGMGPSQGRHSALATARLVAEATGRTVAETGVTTARPPVGPELLGHVAGRRLHPQRLGSMHGRHVEAGAQMLLAGAWLRPAYYGGPGERERAVREEVAHVHQAVGVVDVSTLGGIEVRGADAGAFLERMYTGAFASQPVGRARYAVMTSEAGIVIDDGVACRLHEALFYVTATTGGVERVYQAMLKWNAQWRLDVDIAHVTAAWAGLNIAGPASREVLARLCDDIDLAPAAFPYMGVREGRVAGIAARVIRVGFVGELGFEIHVPYHCGEALWDAVTDAGRGHGIRPFGIEAQRVLRLEKGHIIIGQDTDAMTWPGEVGLGWAIARRKPYFVGKRSIDELERLPLNRKLAGFTVADPDAPIPLESHLVLDGDRMTGRVTSCSFSPALGKPVGLAYVRLDQAQPGARITIRGSGGMPVTCEVVEPPFYDPGNHRQEG